MLCLRCGVIVVQAASGKWIHVDSIPEGVDSHGANPIDAEEYRGVTKERAATQRVREAMAYAEDIRGEMARLPDVEWKAASRHLVVLLEELERARGKVEI